MLGQERAPGLHDLAPTLQHVAAGIALLDLTADRMGQVASSDSLYGGDVGCYRTRGRVVESLQRNSTL